MKKDTPKYRRILLKLSGEALGGKGSTGIASDAVQETARQIAEVRELGVPAGVVLRPKHGSTLNRTQTSE